MSSLIQNYEKMIKELKQEKEKENKLIENLQKEIRELKMKTNEGEDKNEKNEKNDEFNFIQKFSNKREGVQIFTRPCFNKGFYNKDFNITGTGNYSQCFNYIEDNYFNEKSKDVLASQLNLIENNDKIKPNETIILDNQFRKFKFLFYNKSETNLNTFNFEENIIYQEFKNKVRNICEVQYSGLLYELSKFKIKQIYKLCFDLTYITVNLERRGITNSNLLIMKTHENSKKIISPDLDIGSLYINNIQISIKLYLQILKNPEYTGYLIILAVIFNIIAGMLIWNEEITNLILKYVFKELPHNDTKLIKIDENNIDEVILLPKVKFYLFMEENCYFKIRYGKNFDFVSCDLILVKNEILDIINRNNSKISGGKDHQIQNVYDHSISNTSSTYHNSYSQLNTALQNEIAENIKILVLESKNYENKMRVDLITTLTNSIFIIIFAITFVISFNLIKREYGYGKTTIFKFVFLSSIYFFQLLVKLIFSSYFYKNKKYIACEGGVSLYPDEEKKLLKKGDLIVVDKIILDK